MTPAELRQNGRRSHRPHNSTRNPSGSMTPPLYDAQHEGGNEWSYHLREDDDAEELLAALPEGWSGEHVLQDGHPTAFLRLLAPRRIA